MRFHKHLIRILCLVLCLATLIPCASALTPNYTPSSSYKGGNYYKKLTAVELTGNQRADIVAVARSQVGYTEGNKSSQLSGSSNGSKNYTEYGYWYGDSDILWCGGFVNWCASQAGISSSVIPNTVYTPSGVNKFINWGRAYTPSQVEKGTYTPQPGDIIYFKYSRNDNIVNHVGIVTGYNDNVIYTIEGNTTSSGGSSNGGGVYEKSYKITYSAIRYICCPDYANSNQVTVTTEGCFPACSSSCTTITQGLKNIGVDSSYSYRKQIAAANNISGYSGTASQNTQMLKLLKAGTLKKPGTTSTVVSTVEYFPACSSGYTSIVSALKSVGADSSYSYREKIAAANGITGYSGTAAQNTQMLSLLKAGALKKPGGSSTQAPAVKYFPACSSGYSSIVSALKSVGADSSYAYRKQIAAANGITGYSGTAAQNTQMLNLLKAGKLIKP